MNVQVIADPAGHLVWASPAPPGSRHDIAAAREHGILDALAAAGIPTVADTGYQGASPNVAVPQRRRRRPPTPVATGVIAGPLARFSYCERISDKWLAGGALARTPRRTAWWARRTTHAAMTSREK